MLDKDELMDRLEPQHIINIMATLGEKPMSRDSKGIWFRTVCHGGGSHKLCYYYDKKLFNCYTSCGVMSVFELLMLVKGCTFGEAVSIVATEIGIDSRRGFSNREATKRRKEHNRLDRYIGMRKRSTPPKDSNRHLPAISNPNILNYFENDIFYEGWIEEGISIETMIYFDIRWDASEFHIIIPHRNAIGEVVGIRRRSLKTCDQERSKYMPEILQGKMYGHALGLNLYGLYEHKSAILKFKKVVIVESEKSVMLAHEYYGEDAFVIATCGFNITNWQRDMILDLGVEEVILAYDKDFDVMDFEEHGEDFTEQEWQDFLRYRKRIISLALKFTPYCRTYAIWDRDRVLGHKMSPFDAGKETLEFLMKRKIEVTMEDRKYLEDGGDNL